jgi:hypothetical protein
MSQHRYETARARPDKSDMRLSDFEDFILRWKMTIDHAAITATTIGVTVGLKLSDFEMVSRLPAGQTGQNQRATAPICQLG